MDRTQLLELMGTLELYGMRSAYDEVMGNGIKRRHEPSRIVGIALSTYFSLIVGFASENLDM